jgi:hypothetical protein
MRLALRDVPEVARPRSAFKVKRGAFLGAGSERRRRNGCERTGPIKVDQSDQSKTLAPSSSRSRGTKIPADQGESK